MLFSWSCRLDTLASLQLLLFPGRHTYRVTVVQRLFTAVLLGVLVEGFGGFTLSPKSLNVTKQGLHVTPSRGQRLAKRVQRPLSVYTLL